MKQLMEQEKNYIRENCKTQTVAEIAKDLSRSTTAIYSYLKKNGINYYSNKSTACKYTLTPAEEKVMKLVATGLTDKEIAEKLFISTYTVKTHILNIYSKYGVTSSNVRVKAVLKYLMQSKR